MSLRGSEFFPQMIPTTKGHSYDVNYNGEGASAYHDTGTIHTSEFDMARGGGAKGSSAGSAASSSSASAAASSVVSTYTSGSANGYNIQVNFKGTWTADLQKAFIESANKLSSLVTGDVQNVTVGGRPVDDISIDATLGSIDGVGGVLGQAGATSVRTVGYLPATAIMQFDSADAKAYLTNGQWGSIVQHEMIHSIGFSSGIWSLKGLITGAGTATPSFTGKGAAVTYNKVYGTKGNVPLEQDGGAGTRDSHWDEQIFGSELMTGWINKGTNNFSPMTLAALEDMGYDTVWKASDYIV